MRSVLEIGKTYEHEQWMFVVLRKMDTSSFDVLILGAPPYTRYEPGTVMPLWEESIVAEFAKEIK